MTTLAHLRRTGLSFAEAAERRLRSGAVAFVTDGRRFATARDGDVELRLKVQDVERLLAEHRTSGEGR